MSVYGSKVEGCYFTDVFETAFKYRIEQDSYVDSHNLFAAEAFTEDGTLPGLSPPANRKRTGWGTTVGVDALLLGCSGKHTPVG